MPAPKAENNAPQTPSRSRLNNFLFSTYGQVVVTAALMFIVFLIAAFIVVQADKYKQTSQYPQPSLSPTSTPSTNANCQPGFLEICEGGDCECVQDATSNQVPDGSLANWKTYKNEEYGFETKYDPKSNPNEVEQAIYLLLVQFGTNPLKFPHGYEITVDLYTPVYISRSRLGGQDPIKIDSEEEYAINDIAWTKLNYHIFISTDNISITTAITSNDKYSFTITAPSADINQILSTFEFVENGTTPYGEAANETECLELGGTWQAWGLAQKVYCQIPAKDAGRPCTDESECALGCLSQDGTIPGSCQTYKYEFGCYSIIKNGIVGQALCID